MPDSRDGVTKDVYHRLRDDMCIAAWLEPYKKAGLLHNVKVYGDMYSSSAVHIVFDAEDVKNWVCTDVLQRSLVDNLAGSEDIIDDNGELCYIKILGRSAMSRIVHILDNPVSVKINNLS